MKWITHIVAQRETKRDRQKNTHVWACECDKYTKRQCESDLKGCFEFLFFQRALGQQMILQ